MPSLILEMWGEGRTNGRKDQQYSVYQKIREGKKLCGKFNFMVNLISLLFLLFFFLFAFCEKSRVSHKVRSILLSSDLYAYLFILFFGGFFLSSGRNVGKIRVDFVIGKCLGIKFYHMDQILCGNLWMDYLVNILSLVHGNKQIGI